MWNCLKHLRELTIVPVHFQRGFLDLNKLDEDMAVNTKIPDVDGIQDMEAFAGNMAKLMDTSQEIWKLYSETHGPDQNAADADPMNLMPAFANLTSAMAMHPEGAKRSSSPRAIFSKQ